MSAETNTTTAKDTPQLQRTLRPLQLWGLGVGLVISGEYFGWNYGWPLAGTVGFLLSALLVTALYATLIPCFIELAVAVPEAGGAFTYAGRAFGPWGALLAGTAGLVEFLFAPPAIAFALGGYLHVLHPALPINASAAAGLVLFGVVNLLGVRSSTRIELVVTLVAVAELLLFIFVLAPHFSWSNFLRDAMPANKLAIFDALPFAIWLYLGIEGLALAAEEVEDPAKHLPIGFASSIATLIVLALAVMLTAGGVGDWHQLTNTDFPVPGAVEAAMGRGSSWSRLFAGVGLFGLLASLHGIVFGASRQLYAVARSKLLPPSLAQLNRYSSPHLSVVACTVFGLFALATGKTSQLITIAGMGAITLYVLTVASLLVLRRKEPELPRPYRVPGYPWLPLLSLLLALLCLLAMMRSAPKLALAFVALLAGGMLYGAIARPAGLQARTPTEPKP